MSSRFSAPSSRRGSLDDDASVLPPRPRVRSTACYIVAVVVVVEGKVLLIQEAKASCRGEWYLPAGRMEVGETIAQAAVRETEEESGLLLEPEQLLAVEHNAGVGYDWLRFTVTGRITGGSLKTEADADKESIQAGWFPLDDVLSKRIPLRAFDMCSLIQLPGSGRARLPMPLALRGFTYNHVVLFVLSGDHILLTDDVLALGAMGDCDEDAAGDRSPLTRSAIRAWHPPAHRLHAEKGESVDSAANSMLAALLPSAAEGCEEAVLFGIEHAPLPSESGRDGVRFLCAVRAPATMCEEAVESCMWLRRDRVSAGRACDEGDEGKAEEEGKEEDAGDGGDATAKKGDDCPPLADATFVRDALAQLAAVEKCHDGLLGFPLTVR